MKTLFFLINTGLVAIAAWQGYMIFYPPPPASVQTASAELETPGSNPTNALPSHRRADIKTNMENAIVKRNLFKVELDQNQATTAPTPQPEEPLPEKTKLKLTLWGTVESKTPSESWAVIEDLKNRQQDLYKIGDQVMGAQIKKISRNRVILTHNGKDQMLEAETKPSPSTSRKPAPFNQTFSPAQPPDVDKDESPSAMLSSLKSRPYMKDGNTEGLLVYGIRPGSALLDMGLKNGDIIRTVNEIEITNSNDLKKAAQGLEPDQEIRITLSRRGQEKEIFYKGAEE